MKIEHIVSTMNRENIDFINNKNYTINTIIINQTNFISKEKINIDKVKKIKMYSLNERGLSRSRNKGLEYSKADVCIISDDDIKYVDNLEELIKKVYTENKDFDVIVFQVNKNENIKYKRYPNKSKELNMITTMKVSSVEITFKREKILEKNIRFNELFGAGSTYLMGEENIFLNDCLRNNLKILYVPEVIGTLEQSESSWFTKYNEVYFESRGASFVEINKKISILLCIQFAIRKYKIYKNELCFYRALKFMLVGRKKYLKRGKK